MSRYAQEMARHTHKVVSDIKPMLHGHGAEIQGAVLAELFALYIAGHHPQIRQETTDLWLETVGLLLPICEKEIIEMHGSVPTGWLPH